MNFSFTSGGISRCECQSYKGERREGGRGREGSCGRWYVGESSIDGERER